MGNVIKLSNLTYRPYYGEIDAACVIDIHEYIGYDSGWMQDAYIRDADGFIIVYFSNELPSR
jgi:hypothetical protein